MTKKTLLELINNYSKVSEYKVNVQKSIAYIYAHSEQVEIDIKNTIPFIGTSLVVQWLRLHAPNAGAPGVTPGEGTRSHMHAATKSSHATTKSLHATTKEPMCCN